MKRIISKLTSEYDTKDWWPMRRNWQPAEWEVCAGCILTQNASWRNVEKALENLDAAGIKSAEKTAACSSARLKRLVRPAGFFNQKAERLKRLAKFAASFGRFDKFQSSVTREGLLSINGIGNETADSVLLYACHRPYFVVDAYTRRVFGRLGAISGDEDYDEIRKAFEKEMKSFLGETYSSRVVEEQKAVHGAIVEHAKAVCRPAPACDRCVLKSECGYYMHGNFQRKKETTGRQDKKDLPQKIRGRAEPRRMGRIFH